MDKGFEIAHGIKGVIGNLAITPLYNAISEITEELRARKQIDYAPLIAKIKENREKFTSLL